MIGFVLLPVIMSKLLADNGGHEFGDFKLTILEILGTYGFERRILLPPNQKMRCLTKVPTQMDVRFVYWQIKASKSEGNTRLKENGLMYNSRSNKPRQAHGAMSPTLVNMMLLRAHLGFHIYQG